jgi:CheY-like chemotaxis protein
MNCQDSQKELTGCRILLVDDHKDFLDAIRLFLQLRRANVLAATDGEDGLDLVVRHHPEIIISHLAMPSMNGYELLEQVRHLTPKQGGDAPVIALTGRVDAEERGKALTAGFARFLTKPVDPEQLVDEICSLLEPGNLAGFA